MPEDKSTLLVPLRSNGSTLIAGAPVAAFRRRLKYASILFDQIFLEGGVLRLNAGPSLSFNMVEPFNPQAPPRWQTAAARHAAEKTPFQLAVGKEDTPGVPAAIMHPAGYSETSISWVATLYPFADELPPGTDWVEFVKSHDPVGSVKQLADQWSLADERNPSLERVMPVRFVRNTVIKNVNRDLALATASGFAAAIDPFHQRVVAQRFNDDGWKMRGYAVPVIFPAVGDWSWSAIADLRCHRNMVRFRAVLREVEDEAAAEAASGDIEMAVHHGYEPAWPAHNRVSQPRGPRSSAATRAADTSLSGTSAASSARRRSPLRRVLAVSLGSHSRLHSAPDPGQFRHLPTRRAG
jgi:hypothetical protein